MSKGSEFLRATDVECNAGKVVTLSYTTDTAASAGTYKDTLTIGVAVVDRTT